MKRWPMLAAALALLSLAHTGSTEVGELLPVELVYLYKEGGAVCVATDTEAQGTGETLAAALADLHETAPGTVFLDTADYLVLTPETLWLLPELYGVLRPAARVCVGIHADTDAAAFLAAHPPEATLGGFRSGEKAIPILVRRGAGYRLEG